MRSYAPHIRLYLEPCVGHLLLAELKTVHVQAMLTAIARYRPPALCRRPAGVTAATLAAFKAIPRAASNAAIQAGYLDHSPA